MADYLKIPQLARRLDVSEKTARRYVKAGTLPSTFIGGAYRVTEKDLEEFLHGAEVKPEATRPKAPVLSSLEPSLNDALEDERRAAWEAAVVEGRRLRETGWTQMWKALSEWSASKRREEPYAARRKYLDEMGDLLQEVYDADGALGWAYIEAALSQGGSDAPGSHYLREESRTTSHFYGELLGLVKSRGLSVRTGADEAHAAEAQPEARPYSVEEDIAA